MLSDLLGLFLLIAQYISYCNFQVIVQSTMLKEEGYKNITAHRVSMLHPNVHTDIIQQKHIFVCLNKQIKQIDDEEYKEQ